MRERFGVKPLDQLVFEGVGKKVVTCGAVVTEKIPMKVASTLKLKDLLSSKCTGSYS